MSVTRILLIAIPSTVILSNPACGPRTLAKTNIGSNRMMDSSFGNSIHRVVCCGSIPLLALPFYGPFFIRGYLIILLNL